jgi:methylenetetrahydrofolate dehydrogenase (NADP+)/methenyltetrahydrofolate cyclohydrolase
LSATVLDSKAVASEIFEGIASKITERLEDRKPRPQLATIVVGDDPASDLYVRTKHRNAKQVGMESKDHPFPAETTTEQLLELVGRLNGDDSVSGVLVQQPPPPQLDMTRVICAIDPVKDVDGFHPINAGRVALGLRNGVEPCTPARIVELLERARVPIAGTRPRS